MKIKRDMSSSICYMLLMATHDSNQLTEDLALTRDLEQSWHRVLVQAVAARTKRT